MLSLDFWPTLILKEHKTHLLEYLIAAENDMQWLLRAVNVAITAVIEPGEDHTSKASLT